jgi:Kef-type K+ transport system membrane component KefB
MDANADVLAILALVLVGGKLAGQASQRIGLPTPVGKIAVGLLIGPAVLGLVSTDSTLDALSEVGLVLLMFLAGLETDMVTLRRVRVPAFAAAMGGVALPFAAGVGLGLAFDLEWADTLFLAAILTATSVSISAQTLRELGRLQSREGTTILAAAVMDDILGVVILAFVFAVAGQGDAVASLSKMAIFLPVAFVLGRQVLPFLGKRLAPRLSTETQVAVVIAIALTYAWASEELGGVAAVTGAYMAGLLIAQTELASRALHGLSAVSYGFFVPLFFVGIGLQADFGSLADSPWLVVALLGAAIVAKALGCFAGARVCRYSTIESLRVGVGMVSRGEVALVIAAAGLDAGVVDATVFSASVIMALVTTVVTPIALKFTYTSGLLQRMRLAEIAEGADAEEAAQPRPHGPPSRAQPASTFRAPAAPRPLREGVSQPEH